MMRLSSALVCLAAVAAPARSHFIWIVPEPGDTVRVVFSDAPKPDDPALLKKIAHLQIFLRGADGKVQALESRTGKDALEAQAAGEGPREVAAVCQYGVSQRGSTEPFLLNYYAKSFVGLDKVRGSKEPPAVLSQSWDKLPLEVVLVPEKKDPPMLRVLWQGKPLAGAEFVQLVPGKDKPVEGKSDADGLIPLEHPSAAGIYGVRVKHVEAKEGELDGKKYKEIRHYATATAPVLVSEKVPEGAKPAPDAAATKLLADARAARAVYADFRGFAADIEVNLDGKVCRGQVSVNAKAKVQLQLNGAGDDEARNWASRQLASIIAHRLDSGPGEETPCAFADEDTDNPLGRAIRVLNDEFHSSYRIRDHQVMVVNRHMRDARFTITVLENRLTEEKKFLPVSYVVNTWDLKTEALKSSEAFHHTWQRVGGFDLPQRVLVVTALAGKQQARSLTLSNCKLTE
jgi:hypothetical protein